MSKEVRIRELTPEMVGLLVVMTGPTRAGKDMAKAEIMGRFPGMSGVVTYTSRPKKDDEVDGADYHFVSEEKFKKMIAADKFLEWVPYGVYYMGTTKDALEVVLGGQDVIWRIDMSRAAGVEELLREKFNKETAEALWARTLVVAIIPDKVETLRRRWIENGRGDLKEFGRRMRQDARVWRERRDKFPHVIMNPDGVQAETVGRVAELIEVKKSQLYATGE